MIKTLAAAAALSLGFAGYALAQETAPAAPAPSAAPMEHHHHYHHHHWHHHHWHHHHHMHHEAAPASAPAAPKQ